MAPASSKVEDIVRQVSDLDEHERTALITELLMTLELGRESDGRYGESEDGESVDWDMS